MIRDLFQGNFDLRTILVELMYVLPAYLLAISLHEAAHGYVAYRCGDPTAMMLGRVTVNPVKHFDPIGFLMLLFVGVGWAKPVPVNPRNFKNYRRDDLLVSIAGIAINLIQFVAGCLIMYAFVAVALGKAPRIYGLSSADAFLYAAGMQEILIEPVLGPVAGALYRILINYVVVNISLAAFNLLPVPPLDGFHVVNDLVLKGRLFTSRQVAIGGMLLILFLSQMGWLGKGISFVLGHALNAMGHAGHAVFSVLGWV